MNLSNTKIIILSAIFMIFIYLVLKSSHLLRPIEGAKNYNSSRHKKYYMEKFGPKRVLTNTEADISYQDAVD